jgi:hypothetical protein
MVLAYFLLQLAMTTIQTLSMMQSTQIASAPVNFWGA